MVGAEKIKFLKKTNDNLLTMNVMMFLGCFCFCFQGGKDNMPS